MRIVSALFALALGSMSAESVRAEDSLAYGNEALRAWVERSAVETPYLLVDRAANTVRLMQGGALLRTVLCAMSRCPIFRPCGIRWLRACAATARLFLWRR